MLFDNKKTENVETVGQYFYDVLGRRTSKQINTGAEKKEINYLYNGFNLLAEYGSDGKASVQYLSGSKIDEIIVKKEADGKKYYYIRDGLNSVRMVVDAKGNIVQKFEYTPFGEMKGKIDGLSTIFGFTGREYDTETGLYFYRARYYTPDTGRFLSEDPIGILGGMNLYAYCGSNPVNWIDPWGMKSSQDYVNEIILDIQNTSDIPDSVQQNVDTTRVADPPDVLAGEASTDPTYGYGISISSSLFDPNTGEPINMDFLIETIFHEAQHMDALKDQIEIHSEEFYRKIKENVDRLNKYRQDCKGK